MEAFQQEIDKMLNDEEVWFCLQFYYKVWKLPNQKTDDDPRQKEVTKSYVPMNLGSVKGRWGQIEAERKKLEEEKALVSDLKMHENFWVTTNKILLAVHAKTPATSTKNVLLKREIFLVSLLTIHTEKFTTGLSRPSFESSFFYRKNEKSVKPKIRLIRRKLQKTWWWRKWKNLSPVVSLVVGKVF